jgi:hypothetical protein
MDVTSMVIFFYMTFTLFKKVTIVYFVVPPDFSEIPRASLTGVHARTV